MWIAKFWYRARPGLRVHITTYLDPAVSVLINKMDPEYLRCDKGMVYDKSLIDGEIELCRENTGESTQGSPSAPLPS